MKQMAHEGGRIFHQRARSNAPVTAAKGTQTQSLLRQRRWLPSFLGLNKPATQNV
jgi:hypothetical protein